jgi:hypothetical protein
MELWIRSQDKEYLTKVDNIRIKHEYEQKKVNDNYGMTCAYINGKYKCSYIYSDSTWLGEYATKERALEVLDEIQKLLQPQMVLSKVGKPIAETCDGTVYVNPDEYEIKELSTCVYEMPEE